MKKYLALSYKKTVTCLVTAAFFYTGVCNAMPLTKGSSTANQILLPSGIIATQNLQQVKVSPKKAIPNLGFNPGYSSEPWFSGWWVKKMHRQTLSQSVSVTTSHMTQAGYSKWSVQTHKNSDACVKVHSITQGIVRKGKNCNPN